jgi:hypothetical protein
MTLVALVGLCDREKLHVLQQLDQFREWHSLDDKRYCLICGEIITGREIRVIRDVLGKERQRIACPTKDCDVEPTDDVLIKIAMVELERSHLRLMTQAGRTVRSLSQKGARKTIGGSSAEYIILYVSNL